MSSLKIKENSQEYSRVLIEYLRFKLKGKRDIQKTDTGNFYIYKDENNPLHRRFTLSEISSFIL